MTAARTIQPRTGAMLAAGVLALALAAVLLGSPTADVAASEQVDVAQGFHPEILAPHTAFVDDVSAQFRFRYDVPGRRRNTTVSSLKDAGTVVVAKVTWDPEGTSGWHTHPGPVVVTIVEGALEVTNAEDCVARTYEAGEAWVDPGQGNVHVAVNPSTEAQTKVYATFFGVPQGEQATQHVPPVDC